MIVLDGSASMSYDDRWDRARAAANDVLDDLGNEDRAQVVLAGRQFEVLGPATAGALRADLALLDGMHRQLRDAAAAVAPRELDRGSAQRGVTKRALLTGVAAHDLYHAGQIQLLKRMARSR